MGNAVTSTRKTASHRATQLYSYVSQQYRMPANGPKANWRCGNSTEAISSHRAHCVALLFTYTPISSAVGYVTCSSVCACAAKCSANCIPASLSSDVAAIIPIERQWRRHGVRFRPMIMARTRFSPCSMLAKITPPTCSATNTKAIVLAVS